MAYIFSLLALIYLVATSISLRLGYFIFIFLYSTYPTFFSIKLGGSGLELTIQRLMIVCLAVFFAFGIFTRSKAIKDAVYTATNYWYLYIPAIFILISKLAGNLINGTFSFGTLTVFSEQFLLGAFLVFLTHMCVSRTADIKIVLMLLIAALFINHLTAIWQLISGKGVFIDLINPNEYSKEAVALLGGTYRGGLLRVPGLYLNPLGYTALICIVFPIGISIFHCIKDRALKVFVFIATSLSVPLVVATGSRTGSVLILLMIAYYVARYLLDTLPTRLRTMAVTLLVPIVCISIYGIFSKVFSALTESNLGGISSFTTRANQYASLTSVLQDSIWFGLGFTRSLVKTTSLNSLDSYYLRQFYEGGIVGIISFVTFMLLIIYLLIKMKGTACAEEEKNLRDGFLLTFVFIMVMMLVLLLQINFVFVYIFAGLVISLHRNILISQNIRSMKPHYKLS